MDHPHVRIAVFGGKELCTPYGFENNRVVQA